MRYRHQWLLQEQVVGDDHITSDVTKEEVILDRVLEGGVTATIPGEQLKGEGEYGVTAQNRFPIDSLQEDGEAAGCTSNSEKRPRRTKLTSAPVSTNT